MAGTLSETLQKQQPGSARLDGMSLRARRFVSEASAALGRRQAAAAERALRRALSLTPKHPEIQRLLAIALRLQNRNDAALALLREAAARRPDDALVHNGLGSALDACGDAQGAIVAFRRACELAPEAHQLWSNLGKTLSDHGRFEEALPVLERAAQMSEHPATHLRLAYALRAVGRIDESSQRFRDLIVRDPLDGTAWLGLAGIRTRQFNGDDVAAMQVAIKNPNLTSESRISMSFALAKASEDQGRFDRAFELYQQANEQTRRLHPWSASRFSALVDEILGTFADPLAALDDGTGNDVVFIVSMPRSGSTLIEQMLASHPQIVGAGELTDLTVVIQSESARRHKPFPAWVRDATPTDWRRLGREYLERTAHLRQAGKRITDKLPGNWIHVGAIMAMLPGARVIDCRRKALECCLSCFQTLFSEGNQQFSYDLDDIAAYRCDYERASGHWQRLFPGRYRLQHYEELIADPQGQIRELLHFCSEEFDPACLQYHRTQRSVRTASASQVREPIRRDTARSFRYGRSLDPLREALGLPKFERDQST